MKWEREGRRPTDAEWAEYQEQLTVRASVKERQRRDAAAAIAEERAIKAHELAAEEVFWSKINSLASVFAVLVSVAALVVAIIALVAA